MAAETHHAKCGREKPVDGNVDNDGSYRKPRAWKRFKDELGGHEAETLERLAQDFGFPLSWGRHFPGTYPVRDLLKAAIHHFCCSMSTEEQREAVISYGRFNDGKRRLAVNN